MTAPPRILCSGTLGDVPLDEKFRAAATAGFDGVSAYGDELDTATAAGVDCGTLARDLGLMVGELDGVVVSSRSSAAFDDAIRMARSLGARSITMVEAGHYDPSDRHHRREAASAFGALCDRAADHDLLVHIEPFAWSSLGRVADAMAIVTAADRPNGGLLLDLWHHVRGPDRGRLPPGFDHERVFGIQLADTLAAPWSNVRNECMNRRLLPGDGHGRLADRLAELADHGPLPPVGVEVFGEAMAGQPPVEAAATAFESMTTVFVDAGL